MISAFFKLEFKYLFQSRLALLGYFIGIVLNLLIYYLTAKAFIPTPELLNSNPFLSHGYFEFIIIGELCLLIPQVSIGEGQDAFFRMKESGFFEQFFFSKLGHLGALWNMYVAQIFLKFVFIGVSLILSLIFFNLSFTLIMALKFLFLQLLSALFFLGLYCLNLSLSMIVGRRNTSLHHVVNLLSFFSGAYFPIEIFKSSGLRAVLSHSPMALHVQMTRSLVYGQHVEISNLIFYFLWLLIPFILAFIIYQIYFRKNLGRILC